MSSVSSIIKNSVYNIGCKLVGVFLFFSLLWFPQVVAADDYIRLNQEDLHGPVKMVFEDSGNSTSIGLLYMVNDGYVCFFDSLSRKSRYMEFAHEKVVFSEWITYAKNDSSLHVFFDPDSNPLDTVHMRHYDAQGRVYSVNHMLKYELWYRDSLTYNKWGNLAQVYKSYSHEPYYLQQEYLNDMQGNLSGLRVYQKDGSLISGFDVERENNKLLLHHFSTISNDTPNNWEEIIYYTEDGHIEKVITNKEEYNYSEFDEYGNWTLCKCKKMSTKEPFIITTKRRIEYWGKPEDSISKARNRLIHLSGGKTWEERLTDTVKHKPLIVCDGVVVDAYPQSAKDVASVKSLDSKEAMRLYGEQGKNGAIVFTTNDFVAQTGDSTAVAEPVAVADENNTQDDLQAIRLKWRLTSFIAVCFMFIPVVIALIVLLYDRIRGDKVSPAPLRMRFADNALDTLFLALLQAVVILWFVHSTVFSILLMSSHSQYFWRMILSLLQLGGYFLYYFICEYYWGATLGKKLCRLKVVNEDGTKPSSKTIVQRTLSRFLPFELISFFFTDKDENGNMTRMWHDVLSNTRVVRDNPTINNEK